MARTFIRQATQIRRSDAYDDTLAHGVALESGATTLEDDLNSLRAQIKRILDGTGGGKWYDNVPSYNGTPAGLAQVHQVVNDVQQDVDTLTGRKLLMRAQVLADVAVPAGQNYVALSVAGSEAPTSPLALSAGTNGVVAAAAAGSGHSLDAVAGVNAISPKNLVLVHDAATNQVIESGDRDVYALLHAATGAADGGTIDDSANAVRLSFVRINATGDGLEAVPPGELDGLVINYSYVLRGDFGTLPEDAFLANGTFTDLTAEVDVTLSRAAINQQGPVNLVSGVSWNIATGYDFDIAPDSSGSGLRVEADKQNGDKGNVVVNASGHLQVLSSEPSTFSQGVELPGLNVAIVEGEVKAVGRDLSLTTDAGDQLNHPAGRIYFNSNARSGNGIAFATSASEYDDYNALFGGVSILKALYNASALSTRGTKTYATVTANIAADSDVGGTGGGGNLDAQLPDLNYGDFVNDFDIFVNGELLRGGADNGTNNDYYPGTNLSNGQLRFEFALRTGDVICVVPVSQNLPT